MHVAASYMGDLVSVGLHTREAVELDRRFRNGQGLGLDIGRETLSILQGRLVIIGFGSVASSLVAVLVDVYGVGSMGGTKRHDCQLGPIDIDTGTRSSNQLRHMGTNGR
jgi:hypothetical protein